MNRIDKKFQELKEKSRKAFIAYITAGDPNIAQTEKIATAIEEAGADIIELGIPFSDPLADGPVIQSAAVRALSKGLTVKQIMNCVVNIRKNTEIPLIFLVYFNTILNYGTEKFVKRCKEIGIDGLIIPDLPLEERGEIKDIIKKYNVCLIPLVAPTSKKRIRKIIEGCKGFVYCVSSLGVTGQRSEFFNQVEKFLQDVKDQSHIPTAVGFGISSRKSAEYLGKFADGVIVGSAIVQIVEESKGNLDEIKERVKKLIP